MPLVYRIVHKKYAKSLLASGLPGRWNSDGKKVLYTTESVSLAYLETMYYRKGLGYNEDFKIMVIYLPENTTYQEVSSQELPKNWRDFRNYDSCQNIGNDWYNRCKHLCLRVPSAVVPENRNIVINTLHPAYESIRLLETLDFVPDERLEELISQYK